MTVWQRNDDERSVAEAVRRCAGAYARSGSAEVAEHGGHDLWRHLGALGLTELTRSGQDGGLADDSRLVAVALHEFGRASLPLWVLDHLCAIRAVGGESETWLALGPLDDAPGDAVRVPAAAVGAGALVLPAGGDEWTVHRIEVPPDLLVVALTDGDGGITLPVPPADRRVRGATVESARHLREAMVVAYAGGVLAAVTGMTSRYARERVQFGKALARFQAVQMRLSEMVMRTSLTELWASEALSTALGTPPAAGRATLARAYAAEALTTVILHAHQIHGGIGFSTEYALSRYSRRAHRLAAELGREVVPA